MALDHEGIENIPEIYSTLGLLETSDRSKIDFKTPSVLSALASLLEDSIQEKKLCTPTLKKEDVFTIFHSSEAPTISIRQYVERIFNYSNCSTCCFVVAYVYIERFLRSRGVRLTSLNVHRLFITSVLVAAKFMDDEYYSNGYYAKVGGVSVGELNKLEIEYLFSLDFRLHVTTEVFVKYCYLVKEGGRGEQINRPIKTCFSNNGGKQNKSKSNIRAAKNESYYCTII